jgi:hypothetical protein
MFIQIKTYIKNEVNASKCELDGISCGCGDDDGIVDVVTCCEHTFILFESRVN